MPSPCEKKVLVGLSGGVDSAVAALLLQEQGCRVIGATMAIYDGPPGGARTGGCYDCGEEEDIAQAAGLADMLGIAHHVFDCSGQYRDVVLAYFRETYLSGRTPNPCIRCNARVKFGLLPSLARESGLEFDWFATGHYARLACSQKFGQRVLLRARDTSRDQSYFLYRLNQEQIDRALFPLGEMTKREVRALAAERDLPMHDKPDSQNFYGGDYADLLGRREQPGNIVDCEGSVLGTHSGFWHFTPGQRRGLGVAAKTPLYVLRVDPSRNEVVVGDYGQSLQDGCMLEDMHWIVPLELTGNALAARLRSSHRPVRVTVREESSLLAVTFCEPQAGVAPGQSLVLYLDDMVVGGGIITHGPA
jgi:tRNA-specific 2-thiouridylase